MLRTQQIKANEHQVTMTSLSPFRRMIEDTIDKKLTTFMETIKNQTFMPDFTQIRNTVRESVHEIAVENIAPLDMVSRKLLM